jgi:predicted outer membrane repeat protein
MKFVEFSSNFASREGGALYFLSGNFAVKVTSSSFKSNVASRSGGAVLIKVRT